MFIFRVEHNRNVCTDSFYQLPNGNSPTGHGPYSKGECYSVSKVPNYGTAGSAPAMIDTYERCAVTADQFERWISPSYECRGLTQYCNNTDYCHPCSSSLTLVLPDGWDLIAYWVNDESEGIDWREDRMQIVFNPAFAELIGPVEVWEVQQFNTVNA